MPPQRRTGRSYSNVLYTANKNALVYVQVIKFLLQLRCRYPVPLAWTTAIFKRQIKLVQKTWVVYFSNALHLCGGEMARKLITFFVCFAADVTALFQFTYLKVIFLIELALFLSTSRSSSIESRLTWTAKLTVKKVVYLWLILEPCRPTTVFLKHYFTTQHELQTEAQHEWKHGALCGTRYGCSWLTALWAAVHLLRASVHHTFTLGRLSGWAAVHMQLKSL